VPAVLIHYFVDEHTKTHFDEIHLHHMGRFQFPGIVVGITFRLDLQSIREDANDFVTPQWETTKMTTPKSLFWPSEAQTDYQKIVIVTVLVTCGGDALNNCIT
jgi:hypothetical protein